MLGGRLSAVGRLLSHYIPDTRKVSALETGAFLATARFCRGAFALLAHIVLGIFKKDAAARAYVGNTFFPCHY